MESDCSDRDIVERVIPMENIQLMFHYRNPFIVFNDTTRNCKQPRSIISGLCDGFSDVSTNGEAGVIFVSFFPETACHFFRFPLSEIENRSIDMADVSGLEIRQVEEFLYLATSQKERISIIEKFLLKNFSPISDANIQIIRAGIEIIKNSNGEINAATLSEMLSTTRKTLERKFSSYLGKTTKQMINLLRFQGVLHDFSINKNISLTEHGHNNGYFDQSHFIRDFKKFSGYTPGEFIMKYPDFNLHTNSC
jgi:AraC-like DNA-binding protein